MGRFVLRKLGIAVAIASASLASLVAVPAAAQLYSKGYEFLEAIDERDGDVATEMLNEPGTTIINTRDITTGDTGLHIVTARRDLLWVRFLLQRGADPNIRNNKGVAPLQLATSLGFVEGVEELLKKGAQVNITNSTGETPLMAAVHQRNVALIARLLKEGADPDQNDNSGRSARDYVALLNSNEQIVQEFEEADAEREKEGTTRQYGPSF